MDGQRQGLGQGRRRRNKNKSREQAQPKVEPEMIIARRPGAPVVPRKQVRGAVAASAAPKRERPDVAPGSRPEPSARAASDEAVPLRRPIRLVQSAPAAVADDRERERLRLLDRLMASETRGAISRAADELRRSGHEFPGNQLVQLQLLEHFDETVACEALGVLSLLLQNEIPIKRPVFEQRLRRLEECADESVTRDAAANLRRAIRG
jgi:hypothetical protein